MNTWMLLPMDPTDAMLDASGVEDRVAIELWCKMAEAADPEGWRAAKDQTELRSLLQRFFEKSVQIGETPEDQREPLVAEANEIAAEIVSLRR